MNLGSLTTIGSESPKNLIHIVFDNSKHESTGGQPTNVNVKTNTILYYIKRQMANLQRVLT